MTSIVMFTCKDTRYKVNTNLSEYINKIYTDRIINIYIYIYIYKYIYIYIYIYNKYHLLNRN